MSRSRIATVVILAVMVLAWTAGRAAAVTVEFVGTPPSLLIVGTNALVLNPEHPQHMALDPPGSTLALLTQIDPPEIMDGHIAVEKTFVNLEPIYMTWLRGPNAPDIITLEELVVNLTGTAWTDYHISLSGGAVFAADQDPTLNPEPVDAVLNATQSAVTLYYSPGAYLLAFGDLDGVPSAGDVRIDISAVPIGGEFTIVQYPTIIPEPATLLLLGAPIGLLLRRRRR